MPQPIEITLYDDQDEPKKTYAISVIRWGVLKKAGRLAPQLEKVSGQENLELMNELSAFVVEVFHNQFTVAELDDGADFAEVVTVLREIIARATALVKENPTPPPQSK